MDLTDAQFLSVEEYLLEHDYVAPVDMGLAWGSYTITPAGLRWVETSLLEPLPTNRMQELAERPGEEEAFESALRAELEEERRRMEDLERNLNEEPSKAPETSAEEPESTEPRSSSAGSQTATERRWWEFWR